MSTFTSPLRNMRAWARRISGRLVRGEKDVVVSRVLVVREFLRRQTAAEMVTASGRDMDGAADFFILNVAAGERQNLRAKPELTQLTRDRIAGQLFIVGFDRLRRCP